MKPATTLLLVVLLCACNRDQDDREEAPGQRTARDTAKVYLAVYTEPEAVGVLRALGEAEMATARVARDVTLNDDIRRYAGVMISDHRGINELVAEALMQTGDTARDNATSAAIRTTGDSIATALSALPSGFNNTFIEEQIKSHARALQLLDTAIVPSARTPGLKTLLQQLRPALAAHLQRAQQILADRRRAAAERGDEWESGLDRAFIRAPRPPQAQRPPDTPAFTPYTPPPRDTAPPPRDTAPPPPVTTTFE